MRVDENLIEITKYEVLGKLPNPFVFDDLTELKSPDEWEKRRKEIYKTAVELQYGILPPKPHFLEVEPLYMGGHGKVSCYRIHTGTKECPIYLNMYVFLPSAEGKCPAIIDGDLCFDYIWKNDFIEEADKNGIALVGFNRTELAHDECGLDNAKGQIYNTYKNGSFGAIAAWAWGYSRCVDALEKLDIVDNSLIAFTGHSRGGKTAALAGAVDTRAAIVSPNETCAGACSCYRVHIEASTEDGSASRSETLADLSKNYPFWMGPNLKDYANREAELPFDSHFLKALIAPRTLLVSEAGSDIWANPVGSWQTTIAAKEVFKFLGCEENLLWYFRKGYHKHTLYDFKMLINVILNKKNGVPLSDDFFRTPFKPLPPIFDWKAPQNK